NRFATAPTRRSCSIRRRWHSICRPRRPSPPASRAMRPRSLAVAVIVIAAAGACVRLGFWQLSRLEHKRRLNAAMQQALAQPPTAVTDPRRLPDSLLHRRVSVRGVFDERRQVLLVGRSHAGEPGVHVVTPLVSERDSIAVLVDRGWL